MLEKYSNSKTFARWKTGTVVNVLSPDSYIVSMSNGSRRHLHATRMRNDMTQSMRYYVTSMTCNKMQNLVGIRDNVMSVCPLFGMINLKTIKNFPANLR